MTDLTDASIQVRISRKTLATLAMWFCDQGDPPHSLSGLARTSMEILKEFITSRKLVPQITSTLEATKALEKLGLGNLSVRRGGRLTTQKYLQQMQIDEGAFESFPSFEQPFQRIKDEASNPELDGAIAIMQDKDEEVKRALKSVPEGSIVEEKKNEKGKD